MHLGFDLALLRTFVAVVESGGFTRAAERIHLTQSTVSLQIKKLELGLGNALLVRDRAGVVLVTEEGERLLGYARRLLALSAEASDILKRPAAPKTIRLGVPEDFGGRRLIDLLVGFSQRWPGSDRPAAALRPIRSRCRLRCFLPVASIASGPFGRLRMAGADGASPMPARA